MLPDLEAFLGPGRQKLQMEFNWEMCGTLGRAKHGPEGVSRKGLKEFRPPLLWVAKGLLSALMRPQRSHSGRHEVGVKHFQISSLSWGRSVQWVEYSLRASDSQPTSKCQSVLGVGALGALEREHPSSRQNQELKLQEGAKHAELDGKLGDLSLALVAATC